MGQTTSLMMLLVLLMVTPAGLVGVAEAQADTVNAVGCGTSTLEHSQTVSGVDLVGNAGPESATASVDLGVALTPGDYTVRAISMDSHWDEADDEPREQFYVSIGSASTDPIADLPNDADFLGSQPATASDFDLSNIAPEALPGADLGVVSLEGGETSALFTHIDLGTGTTPNSISAAMVTISCATTGLNINFDETTVAEDGTASLTLNVANTGTQDQTGVRIRSRFPAGIQQVGDIVMTAGTSTAVGKVVRWEGDVAAGETAQVVIPILTSTDGLALCGEVVGGTCEVSAELVGVDGGVPSADPAVVQLAVASGIDLELSAKYTPAGGDTESLEGRFTIVVTNNVANDQQTVAAENVLVRTDMASDLTVDSFSFGVTAGTLVSDDLGQTWTVGTLQPGESAALSFNVKMPLAGEYSVRAQVLSADGADIDSVPGNLAVRASRTDTAVVEDDEAAALGVATVPATTTTTTRAPRTTTTVEPEDEGFLLDLPEGTELPEQVSTEPETGDTDEDRTEVAGAVEERQAPIATVELQQDDAAAPLALAVAATLVALSAVVLYSDRKKKDNLAAAATAPVTISDGPSLTTSVSAPETATEHQVTFQDPWVDAPTDTEI